MKLAALLSFMLIGCASSGGVAAETQEPVLLARSQAYELHVRNGRVVQVIPAMKPGDTATEREIRDAEELRRLYAEAGGEPLAATESDEAVNINGWAGLDCVREAKACGQAPEEGTPRVMVLLKFR